MNRQVKARVEQPEMQPQGYNFTSAKLAYTHSYLWPVISKVLAGSPPPRTIFDLGCGNGSTAHILAQLGYSVSGVDPSSEGITFAQTNHPDCRLENGSAYDDLAGRFGQFDCVVSLEVVEHLFYPRKYAQTVKSLLKPDGIAVISTPYHSYAKYLTLAVMGKMDSHINSLWDYGHIKFWSRDTLTKLFNEAGLKVTQFHRAGRVPVLAKSMVVVLQHQGPDYLTND